MHSRSSASGLSKFVRGLFLIGIIVPVQIALVPLFIDYSTVNLLDTYPSMIIPLAGFALPMSIYLFSSFFEYIPRETYEAASLDGAGPYRIFGLITLPLSVNTVVTVVLVNSIFIWNDFIFANTFVLSEGLKTDPAGAAELHRSHGRRPTGRPRSPPSASPSPRCCWSSSYSTRR